LCFGGGGTGSKHRLLFLILQVEGQKEKPQPFGLRLWWSGEISCFQRFKRCTGPTRAAGRHQ
jgi:hypothetical protein